MALANVAVLVWSLGGIDLAGRLAVPWLLLAAGAIAFVPMLANAMRIALWSRFFSLGLGFREGLKVVTGTVVTNSITPSAAGGVPIKVLFLIGEGVPACRAATVIALQTAEDAVVLAGLVAVCLGLSGFQLLDFIDNNPGLSIRLQANLASLGTIMLGVTAVAAALGGAVAAGLFGKRLRAGAAALVRRGGELAGHVLRDGPRVMRRGKIVALANLALALAQWLARFSIAGIVIAAFGQTWQPGLFWLLQYLVQSISSIVPTPGGAGGAEAGFLLLFAPFIAPGVLVAAMSTWRLIFFYLPLTGAALAFFMLQRVAAGDPAGSQPQPAE